MIVNLEKINRFLSIFVYLDFSFLRVLQARIQFVISYLGNLFL